MKEENFCVSHNPWKEPNPFWVKADLTTAEEKRGNQFHLPEAGGNA